MSEARQFARYATEPFKEGTREEFARLRAWLVSVGYTDAELCAKEKVRTVAHLAAKGDARVAFGKAVDVQSVLVILFLDGKSIEWEKVRSILPADGYALLMSFGLLVPSKDDANRCVAPIALIPFEGLHVVSDRLGPLEVVGEGDTPADIVFSPITPETLRFVGLMPRIPCDDYLEMCGGSGIAALIAARDFAKHAVSADITARSTRFAMFSAALNDLPNFTAVQGDLYAPVAGRTFDQISAHPPYVPAEETEMVFRDGGADGEQITRAIIAKLDEFLRPGGQFYLDCVMTDRAGDPLEQRIRRMIGPSEDEFDVLLLRGGVVDPRVYQAERLQNGRMTPDSFFRQVQLFKRLRVEQFVAVTAIVQRRATSRPVITRHRVLSGETRAEHLQWVLDYLTRTVEWGSDSTDAILGHRVRASPHIELRTRSAVRDGAWSPVEAHIRSTNPFAVEAPCPPILSSLLVRCDGSLTGRDLLAALRESGDVPLERTDEDFAQLIRELADAAYIELDAFPHR